MPTEVRASYDARVEPDPAEADATLARRARPRTRDRTYLFWTLQLGGWTGWVVLFSLRDLYWGHPLENIVLLWIDAMVGMALTTGMAFIYRAVWDRPLLVRALTVVLGSYAFAAVWQPAKNYAMFA